MGTYRVTSDNFVLPRGTEVDDEELGGCDVAALIEGGHLEPTDSARIDDTDPSADPTPDPAKAGPEKEK